jgi:hypothetical protein
MRFEAFAFRLTILLTIVCVLLSCTLAWSASSDSNDAMARAAHADSAIASIVRECRKKQTTKGSSIAVLLSGIDSTYCGGPASERYEGASSMAHSEIKANDELAAQAMTAAVLAPLVLFGAFYTIRWLLTGRFSPLWPLRKGASTRD